MKIMRLWVFHSKSKKSNIAEEVTSIDLEWQSLVAEEKESNDNTNDLDRFSTALEYGEHNRYNEVLALEDTRVKLNVSRSDYDYINANWVDGINDDSEKKYIATQAPLPHTMADFWGMIWDQDVHIIVMLTNLSEGGRVKAHAYWPQQASKQYGDIFVCFVSEKEFGSTVVKRRFTISKSRDISGLRTRDSFMEFNKEERTVIQYHYMDWPDHGAPVESETILKLMDDMDTRTTKLGYQNNPFVVHCSAGIGRTGTFVLIHSFLQNFKKLELKEPPEDLSLKPVLSRMRSQRDGFVQRLSQYVFCYKTLERYFSFKKDNRVNFSKDSIGVVSELDLKEKIKNSKKLRKTNSTRERRKLNSSRRISSSTSLDTSGIYLIKSSRDVSEEEMVKRAKSKRRKKKKKDIRQNDYSSDN